MHLRSIVAAMFNTVTVLPPDSKQSVKHVWMNIDDCRSYTSDCKGNVVQPFWIICKLANQVFENYTICLVQDQTLANIDV